MKTGKGLSMRIILGCAFVGVIIGSIVGVIMTDWKIVYGVIAIAAMLLWVVSFALIPTSTPPTPVASAQSQPSAQWSPYASNGLPTLNPPTGPATIQPPPQRTHMPTGLAAGIGVVTLIATGFLTVAPTWGQITSDAPPPATADDTPTPSSTPTPSTVADPPPASPTPSSTPTPDTTPAGPSTGGSLQQGYTGAFNTTDGIAWLLPKLDEATGGQRISSLNIYDTHASADIVFNENPERMFGCTIYDDDSQWTCNMTPADSDSLFYLQSFTSADVNLGVVQGLIDEIQSQQSIPAESLSENIYILFYGSISNANEPEVVAVHGTDPWGENDYVSATLDGQRKR